MQRIALFADIAGRPSLSIGANPLTTAAAVAFRSSDLPWLRSKTPTELPKWKNQSKAGVRKATRFLQDHAIVVASVTVNRDTPQWRNAIKDAELLHSKIASQSHAKAGWAKLPVVLGYELLSRACFLALAHVLREERPAHVFSKQGGTAVECDVTVDKEFSAAEDIDVFKSFWHESNVPAAALWQHGYTVSHPEVTVTTDDDERLLMWADIAAGLCHSARLENPGRIAMPVSCSASRRVLVPLSENNKLVLDSYAFETNYDDVFGDAMSFARSSAK